jgi:hypothetical protein
LQREEGTSFLPGLALPSSVLFTADPLPLVFSSLNFLLFQFHNKKSMFAVLHSDINSLKSGLLHFTSQPYCKKSRSAKVKDGIINLILWNYLIERYIAFKTSDN